MKKLELAGRTKEEIESGANMLMRIISKEAELAGLSAVRVSCDLNKDLGGAPGMIKISATKTEHVEYMISVGESSRG
jgi:hypothetical protein